MEQPGAHAAACVPTLLLGQPSMPQDPGNLVIQRLLMDASHPSSTCSNLVSAKQRSFFTGKDVFDIFPEAKLGGPEQSRTLEDTSGSSCMSETMQVVGSQLSACDAGTRRPSNAPSSFPCSNGRARMASWGVWPGLDPTPGYLHKYRQDLLWQDIFLDPTEWWDNERDTKRYRHPDFKHKALAGGVWVASRLAHGDFQLPIREPGLSTCMSISDFGACSRTVASKKEESKLGNVTGHSEEGELREAVEALDFMVQQGWRIDNCHFYSVLKTCMEHKDLVLGRRVHALSLRSGYKSNAFLATHIIRMYASHGKLEEARQVFHSVSVLNTRVWASIILAHAQQGQPMQAIKLYRQMRESDVKPNHHVFVAVLKACATAGVLALGREVHIDILEGGDEPNIFVGSSLVDMYSKCGCLEHARRVFDRMSERNVVTWNAMIGGYAQQGFGQEAIALYTCMQQDSTTPANLVTYVCLLQACASVGALHDGKRLHAQIQQRGLEVNVVLGNSLVNMYAKCGSLEDACRVFDSLPRKDVLTWNAMITGYAQQGLGSEALAFYTRMQLEGITPADQVTFVCLLQACASSAALHQGKQLHAQIQERGLEAVLVIGNCLVHMYAKCGSIEHAHSVFNSLPRKDVVTWNALLNGYAEYGNGQMALQCFSDMLQQSVVPDGTTFISLLVACSHEGMVDEGQRIFRTMVHDHAIAPTIYHYTCMVDLLGRAGCLDDAETVLRNMPFKDAVAGWKSLLSACKSHGELERGRRCFDYLITLEPENGAAYVLLASMYATAGRWRDVDDIEALRKSVGAFKKPAKASIEVKNHVHEFIVGKEEGDISSKVLSINSQLKEGGHVPQTELVLKLVTDKEKEDALCGHAEKLALAYGLLNTPEGTALLVTKNLRMCNDCHSSTKIMSRLEKREIVVRDAHRLHHFVDGSCSCQDRS